MTVRARTPWLILGAFAVIGVVGYAATSDNGTKAGLSFLCGLVLAMVVFVGSLALVRWAGSVSPRASIGIALMTYVTVVVIFAALLVRLGPETVDRPAFAAGLVVAVVFWIVEQIRVAGPGARE